MTLCPCIPSGEWVGSGLRSNGACTVGSAHHGSTPSGGMLACDGVGWRQCSETLIPCQFVSLDLSLVHEALLECRWKVAGMSLPVQQCLFHVRVCRQQTCCDSVCRLVFNISRKHEQIHETSGIPACQHT